MIEESGPQGNSTKDKGKRKKTLQVSYKNSKKPGSGSDVDIILDPDPH
jgi:hypothetical protein